MTNWGRIVVLLLLTGTVALPADERGDPAVIDAEELSFDRPTHMAHAKGNVVIRYKDATLRADQARYNSSTKDVWAEGHVRLNRDGLEWVMPAMQYNFETKQFSAEDVRGFLDPIHVKADRISTVASNHFTAPRVTLTTCDYSEPHYHVRATRAEIYTGDRVELFNCSVWLGNVPVFWLPVITYSLAGEFVPFSISLGQSSRWGFYALTTTTFKLNPDAELAVHLDERTERGLGGGADLRYRLGKDGQGVVRGYYINDGDPRDTSDPTAGKGLPTNRWLGQWRHKQALPLDSTFTMDVNKQSDRDIVNTFFPSDYRHNSEPDSVFDLTKRGPNFTLSALVRPQLNSFFPEVERLPEVKLAVNRVRLFDGPVFYEGESSAGYYDNEPAKTGDPIFTGHTVRADTFHQLVSPHLLFGWLSVVPRAGGRYTYYGNTPDDEEVRRFIGTLGAETSFKLTRTWPDTKNERLGIDGLRHIVEPFANYSYIPTPNVRSNELFQFDTERFVTLANGESLLVSRYLPLEFPAYNAIDAISAQNTVRFGMRQRLQTRRGGVPWDLIELTGWTDYRVERDSGERDFSDLFATLQMRPTDWVALQSFGRYDFREGVLREFNGEARVGNADRWAVGVGTRYLRDDSNLVSASLTWRLGRRWVAQAYERFDFQDGQWEEQEYVLRQETHDWFITYGFRYRNHRTQSDEKAVYVAVTLKAFPGVRLSANRIDLGE